MKLKKWVIGQQKDKALAHRSSGTQNTYRYLLAHIEAFLRRDGLQPYRTSSWDMKLPSCTECLEAKWVPISRAISLVFIHLIRMVSEGQGHGPFLMYHIGEHLEALMSQGTRRLPRTVDNRVPKAQLHHRSHGRHIYRVLTSNTKKNTQTHLFDLLMRINCWWQPSIHLRYRNQLSLPRADSSPLAGTKISPHVIGLLSGLWAL